ncbi:MAG: hypothetical protein ACE3JQ_09625 [Paenisporosarcina sp.]
MNALTVGIIFLVIGVVLLPMGIMYLKQTWELVKEQELSLQRKILVIILEIVSMFTLTAGFATWLLSISLICIIFGIALIVDTFI